MTINDFILDHETTEKCKILMTGSTKKTTQIAGQFVH